MVMRTFSLKELAVPMMKSLDHYNFLLKSHHRRVAIICYYLGKELDLSSDELFSLVVAACLHDVGALSATDRESLIKEKVENPLPHCIIGAEILESCSIFHITAQIVRNHHVNYMDVADKEDSDISLSSHILHLADRADILIPTEASIVNPSEKVLNKLRSDVETLFHPAVFYAFEQVCGQEQFWSDVQYMDFSPLFDKLEKSHSFSFSIDDAMAIAETWAKVIDFRSEYTLTHSYTVANVADLLASYIGFSQQKRDLLMLAGYLHDIGKLAIDPRIIEKKGTLTIFEENQLKKHVYYTEQMLYPLSKIEYFQQAVMWAERPHERGDGSGYPFSLTENSLDDGCKILAFADSICALMEKRANRNALSIDATFRQLNRESADNISRDIFNKIEPHKAEIQDLILSCHEIVRDEYNEIMHKVYQATSGRNTSAESHS